MNGRYAWFINAGFNVLAVVIGLAGAFVVASELGWF